MAAVSTYLKENIASKILIDPSMDAIKNAIETFKTGAGNPAQIASLIERIDIAPGSVEIRLNQEAVCKEFNHRNTRVNPDALVFCLPFQTRKRGVETKLIIGHVEPEKDHTLEHFHVLLTSKTLPSLSRAFSKPCQASGIEREFGCLINSMIRGSCKPAMKVCVPHAPKVAEAVSRVPHRDRPRKRVMLVLTLVSSIKTRFVGLL